MCKEWLNREYPNRSQVCNPEVEEDQMNQEIVEGER